MGTRKNAVKIASAVYNGIMKAVLAAQATGVLVYAGQSKTFDKLPKLPDGRLNTAECFRKLWQLVRDAKTSDAVKKPITDQQLRDKIKFLVTRWEESRRALPVAVDAPDGTKPQIVKVRTVQTTVDGKILESVEYLDGNLWKPLPEGATGVAHPEIFGLDLLVDDTTGSKADRVEEIEEVNLDGLDWS